VDFFEHQAAARRRTSLLVFYFVVAVVLIVAALNLAAAAIGAWVQPEFVEYVYSPDRSRALFLWRADVAVWTTVLTLLVILGGTLYRWLTLRTGGRAVAELAGGRELAPGTATPAERRLLNIVEEMSIASGVPMPAVYVLDGEPGINAFAAGFTPSDAAVAVTSGSLEKLSRDELQGVIAHEFSHILNGDMRLNIRLVGVLFGILMLALIGRGILRSLRYTGSGRSSRKGKGGGGGIAVIVLAGLALLVIGYIGYFFGRLIQAAVSRQREFLADAAAVQFTRNPAGIGGALRKIGAYAIGSGIVSDNAVQFRHFFFAQAFTGAFSLFATHPPLEQRIRTIDPQWDGTYPEVSAATIGGWEDGPAAPRREFVPPPLPPRVVPTAVLLASVGTTSPAHLQRARQLLAALPPPLAEAARDPARALSVVFSLLLAADPAARARQLDTVRIRHGAPFADSFAPFAPQAAGLAHELRIPLLNLALPALRSLPPAEVAGAVETAKHLIAADGEVTLFEFMLEKALDRHVLAAARGDRRGVVNYYSFGALTPEIGLLLSALARVGSDSADETARAFAAAAARIPALQGQLQLLPAAACGLDAISAALDKLVQATPAIRKVLLLAGTEAIAADGTVEPDEADLLRAVADSLDCPIPPLLGSAA
jgi:Zn-dependent protease with chaperone function